MDKGKIKQILEEWNVCSCDNSALAERLLEEFSPEGEYIKKEDLINHLTELGWISDEPFNEVSIPKEVFDEVPTYSFPDSVGVENYTVEKLDQILEWGYCFCDTDDNEFCKAIKNAIEIITALELLKAEIRDSANHCECVPDGSCIRVDKALEIIDKHIGGKDK